MPYVLICPVHPIRPCSTGADPRLRLATHDFLVFLISDGFGADDETVRLATRLTVHNDVLSAFIYDPLEAQLPDAGRLVVAEGELQLEVNTSDHGLRQQYESRVRAALGTHSRPVTPAQSPSCR